MESEFYSLKETAVIFNVHINTIRKAIHTNLIPHIRIGEGPRSPYRISKKSIEIIHEMILNDFLMKKQ